MAGGRRHGTGRRKRKRKSWYWPFVYTLFHVFPFLCKRMHKHSNSHIQRQNYTQVYQRHDSPRDETNEAFKLQLPYLAWYDNLDKPNQSTYRNNERWRSNVIARPVCIRCSERMKHCFDFSIHGGNWCFV